MARTFEINVDPEDLSSVAEAVTLLLAVVDQQIEFGHGLDPLDSSSVQLAGASGSTANPQHNGVAENIRGSWVEFVVDDSVVSVTNGLSDKIDCVHNLGVPLTSGIAEPNVRWIVMGIKHSGADGGNPKDGISVEYQTGDSGSITADSMPLRVRVGDRTIDDASDKLHISLFFIPAVRWP
jgi:hypothetical protein